MNEIALRLASRIFDQPLIENQYRSAFIEAMIEPYLAPHGWSYTGNGWGGFDFEHTDGRRLEIKQSAAHQTWSEPRNLRTSGAFDIAARTGYYYKNESKFAPTPGRCAQTYVFAWNPLYGRDPQSGELIPDHRNPEQWEFYVVPVSQLPSGRKTIALSKIKAISKPVKLVKLSAAIETACAALPM